MISVEVADRYQQIRTAYRQGVLDRWWNSPATWATDVIPGIQLAPYQARELDALPKHGRVAVRGPRGSGKTMPAALIVLWFSFTRELAGVDWKAPVTAGGWQQLDKFTWPEIHKWANRIDYKRLGYPRPMPRKQLLTMALTLDHGSAFAVNSDQPEKIEGAHAEHLLLVVDEGKSVPDGSWDAMEGYFSNPGEHLYFAISTPGADVGRFADIHHHRPGYEDWYPIHVTIDEAITAKRVTQEWADQRRAQWGEDSQAFRTHVLAEFAGEEDGVIPLAWVEAAVQRWYDRDLEAMRPVKLGVDVAGSDGGGDRSVIAYRDGDTVYKIETFDQGDTLLLAERVEQRAVKGTVVAIDAIGVGDGTTAALKRVKTLDVQPFVASAATKRREKSGAFRFANKRSAAWWNLREMLDPNEGDDIALPDDPELLGDLTAPKWREVSGGKVQVESKDQIRKRIGRSTDMGDAVIMAFFDEATRTRGVLDLHPNK